MDFFDGRDNDECWEKLQEQRLAGRFCDVVFHVGKEDFLAHRNVLAAHSAYFSSIFNAMNVAKEHVTVPCQNPDIMTQILRFIYTGSVNINQNVVLDLLKLSSTYLLPQLKIYCKTFLETNLNLTNCLTAHEYAERYVLQELKVLTEEYIKKNITFIVVGTELLHYSFEQIASFLWNKKWCVDESSKFSSVCHWVNMDPKHNSRYFVELLGNIWLGQVSEQMISEVFEICPMFNDTSMKKIVFDAMMLQSALPGCFQEEFHKLSADSELVAEMPIINEDDDGNDDVQRTQNCVVEVISVENNLTKDENTETENWGDSKVISIEPNGGLTVDNENKATLLKAVNGTSETCVTVENDDQEGIEETGYAGDSSDPDYQPEVEVKCDSDELNINKGLTSTTQKHNKSKSRLAVSKSKIKKEKVQKRGIPKVRIKLNIPTSATSKRKQTKPMQVKPRPLKRRKHQKCDTDSISDDDDDTSEAKAPGHAKKGKEPLRKKSNQVCICEICGFKTSNEERFKKHEMQAHKDGILFKCHKCEYETSWNREYYRHMKHHFTGPPYECDIDECDYSADRIQFLLLHRMKHTNERPYECTVCNSKFRNKWTLTTHLKIHTGEKPFVCPICNQSFGTKGTMQQHMVSHSDARPYLCDICGFTTKYQSHLTTHKRIHTGNVFRCTVCEYFTPKRNQLQNHMKIHLSIRSFVCKTCGRAFTEKSHMVRHERIHSADKPFKCEQCNYASNRRDKLKEHVAKHHTPGVESKTPYRPRRSRKSSKAVDRSQEQELPSEVQESTELPQVPIALPQQQLVAAFPVSDATKQTIQPHSLYVSPYNTDGMLLAGQMVTTSDSTVDGQVLGLTHMSQPTIPVTSLGEGQVIDPRLFTCMMAPMQAPREVTPAQPASNTPVPQPAQGSHIISQQQLVQQQDSNMSNVAYITLSKY